MATFYSLLCILNCLSHIFATSSNINRHLLENDDRSLFEYGIITGDKVSDEIEYVFLYLYFAEYGYFCRINPYKTNTPFVCRQNEWVVEERCFDDDMGEFVLVIENYSNEKINIKSVIINGIPIKLKQDIKGEKQYKIPFSYKDDTVIINPDDVKNYDTDNDKSPNDIKFSITTNDAGNSESEGQLTMRYYSKDDYKYICRYFPEKKNTQYTCDNDMDNGWVRYSCDIANPRKLSLNNPYTDMVGLTQITVDAEDKYKIKSFCAKKGSINGGDSGSDSKNCPDSFRKYDSLRIGQGDYKPIYWLKLKDDDMSSGYAKVMNGTYLYKVEITACDGFDGDMDKLTFMLKGDLGNTIKFAIGSKFKVSTKDDTTTYMVGATYIGRFIEAIFEPTDSNDICMKSMTFKNTQSGEYYEFGSNFFGAGVWIIKDGGNSFQKHPDSKTYPHTFLKVYPEQFRVTLMADTSNMKLLIHTCDDSNDQSKEELSKIQVSITGTMTDGSFVSTELISLKSDSLDDGRLREFQWNYVSLMTDISLVQIRNDDDNNLLCIDKVKINDQTAFITNTEIGKKCSDGQCSIAVYAVLAWPVCKIEAINTRYSLPKRVPEHVTYATAECNNYNRFISTDCEISQTFTVAQETKWDLQTGTVESEHYEHEMGIEISLTKEYGGGGLVPVKTSVTLKASRAFRWGDQTDTYDLKTESNTTSRSEEVHCGSSVTVPPQEKVIYELVIESSTESTQTLTDLKLWKCSFLFDNDNADEDDQSHYMIIQDVPGEIYDASATNCDVKFQQATPLFSKDKYSCKEAVELVGQSYGTYIPVCKEKNPDKWNECQCSWGGKTSETDCICVDKNNGNPTGRGAVMKLNQDLDKWCEDNCDTDSKGKVFVFDNNDKIKGNVYHYVTPLWVLVFIAATFVGIYGISTFRKSGPNKYGHSKIEMYSKSDIDTENEV